MFSILIVPFVCGYFKTMTFVLNVMNQIAGIVSDYSFRA